jgi:2',3'-cyclic-nucleotide 2'-phosphodiesterase (5'-nucleotidase family)
MPDAAVAARVAEYQKVLSQELDVPLGKTATELDSRKAAVRTAEAAIGNLLADAMRERMDADVAIMNGGGIRGNKTYAAGSTLTRRDVLTELPFGNKLFKVDMSGAELLTALENGLWYAGKPNGRFAHVSGAIIRARADAAPGERVQDVIIAGAPLDREKRYTVATNDFIVSGKEGYDVFKDAKILIGATDGPLLANVLMGYIRAQGTVSARIENRIVLE